MKKPNYNPDVLLCLANLSNDEVFTPPNLVNQILDLLPEDIWKDKNAKFLDPVSKTGVFLREIAKRLNVGLEKEIPNHQDRINHIFQNQVYGIAITELTALLSRRSLYCSKTANSKYSVTEIFKNEKGNILFDKIEHNWINGSCSFCGANKKVFERDEELETHAYQFIHTDEPEKILNMKFDVIIGNPPYQLNDGGGMGTSAKPIYHRFVSQAKKLNPRFLSMIIPSRWFSGGKGLDQFREEMLNDKRIIKIFDYFDSAECFPGVDLSGGVCYFLWSRDTTGDSEITTIQKGKKSTMVRPLLENKAGSFVRFNEAIPILRKVQEYFEESFMTQVSARNAFKIKASFKPLSKESSNTIQIFAHPHNGFILKKDVTQNTRLINEYKIFIAKAYGERGAFPYRVLAKPFLGKKMTCCTETYLLIGPYPSQEIAENVMSYITTKFFRLFVLFKKNTQNAAREVYSFVPMQNFSESWTDQKLYEKYKLSKEEIEFIESMIKPMD